MDKPLKIVGIVNSLGIFYNDEFEEVSIAVIREALEAIKPLVDEDTFYKIRLAVWERFS